MHFFESSIEVEASVQQCVKVWRECITSWAANENFMDLESLTGCKSPRSATDNSQLDWDIAANSNENYQVLWWHQKNSLMNVSGVINFNAVVLGHQTHIVLMVVFNNSMSGTSAFWLETHAGLALQRTLKQLKCIIASHIAQAQEKEALYAMAETA